MKPLCQFLLVIKPNQFWRWHYSFFFLAHYCKLSSARSCWGLGSVLFQSWLVKCRAALLLWAAPLSNICRLAMITWRGIDDLGSRLISGMASFSRIKRLADDHLKVHRSTKPIVRGFTAHSSIKFYCFIGIFQSIVLNRVGCAARVLPIKESAIGVNILIYC